MHNDTHQQESKYAFDFQHGKASTLPSLTIEQELLPPWRYEDPLFESTRTPTNHTFALNRTHPSIHCGTAELAAQDPPILYTDMKHVVERTKAQAVPYFTKAKEQMTRFAPTELQRQWSDTLPVPPKGGIDTLPVS